MRLAPPLPGGVLAAVSGGAASCALALLLSEAKVRPLHLAHVQHGFRPAAADQECALLQKLSRRLDVPLHVLRIEPPPRFVPGAKVPEAAARDARYRRLLALARELALPVVAVAHH